MLGTMGMNQYTLCAGARTLQTRHYLRRASLQLGMMAMSTALERGIPSHSRWRRDQYETSTRHANSKSAGVPIESIS